MKPSIIAVGGGTCSGKTSVATHIQSLDPENICIISQDAYYKGLDEGEDPKCKNFDDPNAIEWELLIENLIKLKNGESVYEPIYDFGLHKRLDKTTLIKPTTIIIVEGILIFYKKELLNLFDKKIFIDADSDIRYRRRVNRDVKERARSIMEIDYQWDTFVKPSHNKYIEDTKNYTDIILRNNTQIEKINVEKIINFDIIDIYIKHILKTNK